MTFADMSPDQLDTCTVRLLLAERCVRCHGPKRASGGLRVDSLAAMLEGGDSGPALVSGDPEKSLLIRRVAAGAMPPQAEPLTEKEIVLLKEWITRKPEAPADEK